METGDGQRYELQGFGVLIGTSGHDAVTLRDPYDSGHYAMQVWTSKASQGAPVSLIVQNVETLTGTARAEAVRLGDTGNQITLRGIDTLTGGAGYDMVRLDNPTNSTDVLTLSHGVDHLIGSEGYDAVRLGADASPMRVSGSLERLIAGSNPVDVTVFSGNVAFEAGGGGGVLRLDSAVAADTITFSAISAATLEVTGFHAGGDRVAFASELRTAIDADQNGVISTGEVLGLTDVAALQPGYAVMRAALEAKAHVGNVAVFASDGTDGAVLLARDSDGDGRYAASDISLLGLFRGAVSLPVHAVVGAPFLTDYAAL